MAGADLERYEIAVIVPCFNEEAAIADVVRDFSGGLPGARVCVFDNGSTDRTAEVAARAGAEVFAVSDKGKGHVVRRMFADVEADIYVMADGDGTYQADAARTMVEKLVAEGHDMVVGTRVSEDGAETYRFGHAFGNKVLTGTVTWIFGEGFTDMLSGYRVFSRRYVKSFPAVSKGFETETELTVHALELRAPYGEVPTLYRERAAGTQSKLSTYKDGARILRTILRLFMRERPHHFYMLMAASLALASLGLGIPIVIEWLQTGLVPRFPTAFLAGLLMLGSFLALVSAIILDNVVAGRRETKRLTYLSIPGTRGQRTN